MKRAQEVPVKGSGLRQDRLKPKKRVGTQVPSTNDPGGPPANDSAPERYYVTSNDVSGGGKHTQKPNSKRVTKMSVEQEETNERDYVTLPKGSRWASRIVGEADVRPTVLIPNPQNFRKHPKAQQAAMAGALDELGWIQRVIVNKRTGNIIDGHLRVEMAIETHEATVPVCYVDLDENEERIALATFDPISAMAIMDEDIHAALLRSIECENAALAGLLDVAYQEDLSARPCAFSEEQLIAQIQDDWPQGMTAEQVVSGIITPAMAMSQFNKLAQGGDTGYYISALFNPHRLQTNAIGGGNYVDACDDPKFRATGAKFIARQVGECHPSMFVKYSGIGWSGKGQLVYEFRPAIARDLYLNYAPQGSRVLDPCHGWGGRVIGWLASGISGDYVGFDPSTKTHDGVACLIKFLTGGAVSGSAKSFCLPFEDADLESGSFDFALTSPPYYDTEKYSDESTNSLNRYKTLEAWVEGFYRPFILKTLHALKPGSAFILNVGNRVYPLSTMAAEIACSLGAKVEQIDGYTIGRGAQLSGHGEETHEDFLCLRLPAKPVRGLK